MDTFTVNIDHDVPPGPIFFEIIGTTDAAVCNTLVRVTVITVDLDNDSDNNNGIGLPDRSLLEDMIETTPPGKLLCVNDDDDDGNGVPDKDQEPPPAADNDLVRMVVELDRNDPGGKWRLQYDASTVQV